MMRGDLRGYWKLMMMGYSASPYFVTKYMMMIEKLVRGNRLDPSNVFRWELVKLNLPGIPFYNPKHPLVYK